MNISIMVDYAHEPASMEILLQTLASYKTQGYFDKIIQGSEAVGYGDIKILQNESIYVEGNYKLN